MRSQPGAGDGLKVLVDGRPVSRRGREARQGGRRAEGPFPSGLRGLPDRGERHGPGAATVAPLEGAKPRRMTFRSSQAVRAGRWVSQYQIRAPAGLAAKTRWIREVWKSRREAVRRGGGAGPTDAQATKEHPGRAGMAPAAGDPKDVACFSSRARVNDPNGIFHFLPVDAELEKLKRTGLAQSDVVSTVPRSGKVLVFMTPAIRGTSWAR